MQETWVWSLGWEDPLEKKNGNLLQYSCLENSMDRGVWWAFRPWGHKELDMTEHVCKKKKKPKAENEETMNSTVYLIPMYTNLSLSIHQPNTIVSVLSSTVDIHASIYNIIDTTMINHQALFKPMLYVGYDGACWSTWDWPWCHHTTWK